MSGDPELEVVKVVILAWGFIEVATRPGSLDDCEELGRDEELIEFALDPAREVCRLTLLLARVFWRLELLLGSCCGC